MKIGLKELLEALDRRHKLRRVPRGVIAEGLDEAAFLPALNGIWVEMPGGRHFVVSRGGSLTSEIVFDAKHLIAIRKSLGSLLGKEQVVELIVDDDACWFVCGGMRIKVGRKVF